MTTRRMFPLIVVAAGALAPVAAHAQLKLSGTVGLGRPVRPLDARARAMGGAAVVLHGGNLSAVNPAALGGLENPGFWIAFAPESRDVEGDRVSGDVDTEDFTLGRFGTPFSGGWAVSVAFGSFIDQDWAVRFIDTLEVSTGEVEFEETRTSDGGIAQFRVDLARRLSDRLSLGLAGILYSGEAKRRVDRAFPADEEFQPYQATAAIRSRGWGVAAGIQVEPVTDMLLGAVLEWSPTGLDVENDSTGEQLDVDLPLAVDFGASWRLTPGFILAGSVGWAGWSVADDDLPASGAVDVVRGGVGVELRLLGAEGGALFGRIGGHWERSPFEVRGGAPVERALTLGLGAVVAEGRGRVDSALELGGRGSRESNGIEESFTRFTLTLGVFVP